MAMDCATSSTIEQGPFSAEAFPEFDAVLVSTAHEQFKDPGLWGGVKLVVDTRNMVEPLFGKGLGDGPKRVVKA
jgi:UDP-N-acetyl-D-mannosaminuronate dehydrogenase